MKPSERVAELIGHWLTYVSMDSVNTYDQVITIVKELEEALTEIVDLPKYEEYIKGRLTFLVMRDIAQRALKGGDE